MYNNLYYPGKLEIADRKEGALRSARQQCMDICAKLEAQKWERDWFRQEILLAAQGVAVPSVASPFSVAFECNFATR